MKKVLVFALLLALLAGCGGPPTPPIVARVTGDIPGTIVATPPPNTATEGPGQHVDPAGDTLSTRFGLPEGFVRTPVPDGSFAAYLRNLVMEPDGTEVVLLDGQVKWARDYAAVVKTYVSQRDVMREAQAMYYLQMSYLFDKQDYARIKAKFMTGFSFDYTRWRQGERITVNGSSVSWSQSEVPDNSREGFYAYLDTVFSYTNFTTLRETLTVAEGDIRIGDVLYSASNPAAAMIVADCADNPATGERIVLLLQGGNPAQPLQVVRNFGDGDRSPWYSANGALNTPAMTFTQANRYRWTGL